MTTSDDDAPEGGARPRRADRGAWSPGSGPPPWVVARRRRWASGGNGGPWPPHGRGGFRRFGCLFVLVGLGFAVLFVSGATVVLRLLGHILGRLAGAPGAPTAPLEIDAATTLAVVVFVVAIVALAGTTRRLGGFARTLDDPPCNRADAAPHSRASNSAARSRAYPLPMPPRLISSPGRR